MLLLGLPALPLMWLLHIAYHWPHAKDPERGLIQPTLSRHMKIAGVGVAVWTVAFITWWAVFATQRVKLGSLGDALVVVDVKGL
ncbi:hypothetical protein BCR44DRAFT_128039 [Catenaria anguillulae PL171]|uniref:Uncharacterized protein n=1 Tax=Catenaria anguillulae PL171 TaxID=765915 RepID=A0A1Y2I310_9FUNG|nr:hypothetical protein BCR44DRAFT_128039 [Catenaria anguillulae PL171]